jgi:hypothetical protein
VIFGGTGNGEWGTGNGARKKLTFFDFPLVGEEKFWYSVYIKQKIGETL